MKPEQENIRLLMPADDGEVVYRTLRGKWLIGAPRSDGTPGFGNMAERPEREQWGSDHYWYIIRADSGKLVVYREPLMHDGGPRSIEVYDDFEAMQPHVPPTMYRRALQEAGLAKAPQYRPAPAAIGVQSEQEDILKRVAALEARVEKRE
jgi:hypothetical protein